MHIVFCAATSQRSAVSLVQQQSFSDAEAVESSPECEADHSTSKPLLNTSGELDEADVTSSASTSIQATGSRSKEDRRAKVHTSREEHLTPSRAREKVKKRSSQEDMIDPVAIISR